MDHFEGSTLGYMENVYHNTDCHALAFNKSLLATGATLVTTEVTTFVVLILLIVDMTSREE